MQADTFFFFFLVVVIEFVYIGDREVGSEVSITLQIVCNNL